MNTQFTLTREQYDIAWHDLELGEQPYPLAILQHGETMRERAQLRQRVYAELADRGLASGDQLDADLASLLRLLNLPRLWLDVVWWMLDDDLTAERTLRTALLASTGDHGVYAEVSAAEFTMVGLRGTAIVYGMQELLPFAAAAYGRSLSVPVEALREPTDTDGVADRMDSIFEPEPSAAADTGVRTLEKVLTGHLLAGGQVGVNARDDYGRTRRAEPLQWFDTDDGRWLLQYSDGHDHLMLTPADSSRMVTRLHEMIDGLTTG